MNGRVASALDGAEKSLKRIVNRAKKNTHAHINADNGINKLKRLKSEIIKSEREKPMKEKKAVKKAVKAEKKTAIPLPLILIGKTDKPGDPELGELVSMAAAARERLELAANDYAKLEHEITDRMVPLILANGMKVGHIESGDVKCSVTVRETLTITDAEKLRGLLGSRFDDLVRVKESYHPEKKLRELLLSADDPMGNACRAYVQSKTGKPGVTFSAAGGADA